MRGKVNAKRRGVKMAGWLDAWRNKGNGKSAAGQKENKNRDIKRPTSVSGPIHTHTHTQIRK